MPPKKKAPETSKKADQKKKEKIIEDKTFGLKNKKGAKTQKFIQQVQHQVKHGNQNPRKTEQQQPGKKEDKKKELDELNQIFRPVQKVEKGADPKSVLCVFYKNGQCSKGDKCKFSHDMSLDRKSEKKSIYVDTREENEDTMENWDVEKLKEVVDKKHGEREKKLPPTDIICKHFLEALESGKYGWFWECPNGGDKCHYRHALPPGFVLNRDKKKQEKKDDITIEELVEIERAKLGCDLMKITLETFLQWKKSKIKEREEKNQKETDRKKAEYKAGRNIGLSGRDMFTFDPELAKDADMEEDEAAYDNLPRENEDDDHIYKDITLEFTNQNFHATSDNISNYETNQINNRETNQLDNNEINQLNNEINQLNNYIENPCGGVCDTDPGPIDETLFDDDLDDLDEEIDNLSIK